MPVIYGRCISAQDECPTMKDVPFENCFGMHIDIKYTNRKSNQLKGLIRQAKLEQPDPSITSIDY